MHSYTPRYSKRDVFESARSFTWPSQVASEVENKEHGTDHAETGVG